MTISQPRKVCSPYLVRARRSLPEACHELERLHMTFVPPCQACPLADSCTPSLHEAKRRATALPRARAGVSVQAARKAS